MKPNRIPAWPAFVVALALALAVAPMTLGCGGTPAATAAPPQTAAAADQTATTAAPATAPTEVELMMDWLPWVLDIPIDVAQAKGYYEEQGLSVKQTLPAGPTDVVKFVSTGRAQFGLYYAPDMLMALEEGASLVSVGSIMPHAPVGMALRPGLTGDSPTVLEGQTVSVPLIPSTRASFTSMLSAAGLDPKSVNVADPGFELVAPLLQGTVAAAAFTEFGELVAAEAQGYDLTYLDFREWGTPDFAFLNVITTQEYAKSDPDTVRAFLAATLEGLTYAATHPDEAVDLYVQAHPELDTGLLLAQWKAAIPHLALDTAGKAEPQDLESWKALETWMTTVGLLKAPVDLAPAITNEYLPAAG